MEINPIVYYYCKHQVIIIFILYVDDSLITRSYMDQIHALQFDLKNAFEIKDLGLVQKFLSIQVL